jgi:hypothetical protein
VLIATSALQQQCVTVLGKQDRKTLYIKRLPNNPMAV